MTSIESVPLSDVPLESKIRFLRCADAYPGRPTHVETVETHFAYVFLTDRHAYKLKKPIRFHAVDFRTLESRRASCESEVALNSRLGERVYIGVVPLSVCETGLALETPAGTAVVDWLVKMHRLPRERMLDARAAADDVSNAELRALVAKLAAFYARARRAAWDGPAYRRHLERQVRTGCADLATRAHVLDDVPSGRLMKDQLAFLSRRAVAIEARCSEGRVVDAHGDLRPEHILLADEPQIIDCVEFSAELRLLDTAEEIAFLALECTELGRPALAARVVSIYRDLGRDALPQPLFEFYYSQRALARARSCAWHLDEPLRGDLRAHWIRRTERYLEAARAAIDRAHGDS